MSAYATAAAAAGVSLAAMAAPAEAKIVYTPTNTTIQTGTVIDLNHDGVADFRFSILAGSGGGKWGSALSVGCAVKTLGRSSITCNYQTNQVWGRGVVSGRFVSALPAGFAVRPSKPYFQQGRKAFYGPAALIAAVGGSVSYGTSTQGQWFNTTNRYLGLQFVIQGQVHYGWARLSVSQSRGRPAIVAVLTGYAYETIPSKPIITGKTKGPDVITLNPAVIQPTALEPATLGHLARGASQIPFWR